MYAAPDLLGARYRLAGSNDTLVPQGNCCNDALVAACCPGCALGQMIAEIEKQGGGGGGEGEGDSGVLQMTR